VKCLIYQLIIRVKHLLFVDAFLYTYFKEENKLIKTGLVNGAREHLQLVIDHTVKENVDLPIKDFVILSLYNSITNKVFDIKLLLDNNQHDSIDIIVRTIFEQYVYLKYILLSHTETKAKQFYYSYKIQSAAKGKSIFINFVKNKELYGDLPALSKKGQEQLGKMFPDEQDFDEDINKYLEMFKSNIRYEPHKKNKKFYEKWYKIDNNLNNLRDLVNLEKMDIYEAIYEVIYSFGSMSVHGIDVPGNIIPNDEVTILGKNINESSNNTFVGVMLMDVSRKVTNHYKLNKNDAIRSKLKKMELSYKYR